MRSSSQPVKKNAAHPMCFTWTVGARIHIFARMSGTSPAVKLGHWLAKIRHCPTVLWRLEARVKGVTFEGSSVFLGRPLLSVAPNSTFIVGDAFSCFSALRANPLGCFQPCVLRTLTPGAELRIGKRVGMSGTVICAASKIYIGEGTIFGSGAMVLDNDFHVPVGDWDWSSGVEACSKIAKPISIGRGVFVGTRAIILKGVTIGDRAVIGAGAVVTKDVPAGHIAAGNPARNHPPKTSATQS